MGMLKINSIYRHFKGKYVYIVGMASDSETLEDTVIYRHVGDDKLWVRKLSMFFESIDEKRIDNITNQKYRFELVDLEEENIYD